MFECAKDTFCVGHDARKKGLWLRHRKPIKMTMCHHHIHIHSIGWCEDCASARRICQRARNNTPHHGWQSPKKTHCRVTPPARQQYEFNAKYEVCVSAVGFRKSDSMVCQRCCFPHCVVGNEFSPYRKPSSLRNIIHTYNFTKGIHKGLPKRQQGGFFDNTPAHSITSLARIGFVIYHITPAPCERF